MESLYAATTMIPMREEAGEVAVRASSYPNHKHTELSPSLEGEYGSHKTTTNASGGELG